MIRRPLVWLLGVLALLAVGWLAYEPWRQAREPLREAREPPAEAVTPRQAVDERAAAAEPTTSGPPASAVPGSAGGAASEPPVPSVAAESTAKPASAAAAPAGADERPTVAAPAPAQRPPAKQQARSAAPGRDPARPSEPAPAPDAALLPTDVPRADEESAAAAAPAAAQQAQTAALDRDPARPSEPAPAPDAALLPTDVPPAHDQTAAAAAREIGRAGRREPAAGAGAPDPSETPRPAAQASDQAPLTPAPGTPELPAPAIAMTQPAPTETASRAPEPERVAPAPTVPGPEATVPEQSPPPSRMLASIRRALASILGGAPEKTDPAGRSKAALEEPAAEQATAALQALEAGAGEPELVRPSFDIVRVDREGRTVVAGRAAPGAEVELRAGDRVLDRVQASARGEWVATPLEPLPPGGQELRLAARSAGAPPLEAEQVVVVAVPEPPPPELAKVAAERPPAEPVAMLLPKDGSGGGRVLQAPGRIDSDELALLVLDYDHAGRIRLTGEGPPGAPVRIYVDNLASSEVVVEPSGRWSAMLEEQLAPGDYTLRLDQVGSEGRPVARLETPFTRVSEPPVAGAAQVDYVVVQPGNSLWRIARRLFGKGFKYVHIYDANQAQIRDPDLIYPGQVFEIPAAIESAG